MYHVNTNQIGLDVMNWTLDPTSMPYEYGPEPEPRTSIIEEPPSNFHPELSSNPDDWGFTERHHQHKRV